MKKVVFMAFVFACSFTNTAYGQVAELKIEGNAFCGKVSGGNFYGNKWGPPLVRKLCLNYADQGDMQNIQLAEAENLALTSIIQLQNKANDAATLIAKLQTDLAKLQEEAKILEEKFETHKKEVSESIVTSFDNLPVNLAQNPQFKAILDGMKKSISEEVD